MRVSISIPVDEADTKGTNKPRVPVERAARAQISKPMRQEEADITRANR